MNKTLPMPLTRRGLAAAAPALIMASPAAATPDADQNAALVRKFWDAFNRAAWDELDALVAPTYRHQPTERVLTLAEFKRGGRWVHRGLADYRLDIGDLVHADGTVAVRWTARGRHVGSMFGEPPTGKLIITYGMHFHRIAQGRIAEDWEVIDFDHFRRQLLDTH